MVEFRGQTDAFTGPAHRHPPQRRTPKTAITGNGFHVQYVSFHSPGQRVTDSAAVEQERPSALVFISTGQSTSRSMQAKWVVRQHVEPRIFHNALSGRRGNTWHGYYSGARSFRYTSNKCLSNTGCSGMIGTDNGLLAPRVFAASSSVRNVATGPRRQTVKFFALRVTYWRRNVLLMCDCGDRTHYLFSVIAPPSTYISYVILKIQIILVTFLFVNTCMVPNVTSIFLLK